MRHKSFLGLNPQGFHQISYQEWGDPCNEDVVLCIHGLTRNGGDFYWLAEQLSKTYRVVCPDMVGRGRSTYLYDGARYHYAQYMSDVNALIARLNVKQIKWVGTSMGGIIGMMLASQPLSPISAMVLNDIGPFVSAAGLQRLAKYVPKAHVFTQFEEAVHFLKTTLLGCRDLTALQWKQMAEQSIVWDAVQKRWTVAYDPAIASTIPTKDIKDLDFWKYWERIVCPVLAMQGADSDLLSSDTLEQMARKPAVKTVSFPKQGHALSLATPDQIALIEQWFAKHDASKDVP